MEKRGWGGKRGRAEGEGRKEQEKMNERKRKGRKEKRRRRRGKKNIKQKGKGNEEKGWEKSGREGRGRKRKSRREEKGKRKGRKMRKRETDKPKNEINVFCPPFLNCFGVFLEKHAKNNHANPCHTMPFFSAGSFFFLPPIHPPPLFLVTIGGTT